MKVGFPRPRDTRFGLPVPFTARSLNMVGAGDDERIDLCISEGRCSVCGLELGEECYVATSRATEFWGCTSRLDPGLTHEKCAQMAQAFCPHFRNGMATMVKVSTVDILTRLRSSIEIRIFVG